MYLVRNFVEATSTVVRVGVISDAEPPVEEARDLIVGLPTGPLLSQQQTADDEWLFTLSADLIAAWERLTGRNFDDSKPRSRNIEPREPDFDPQPDYDFDPKEP